MDTLEADTQDEVEKLEQYRAIIKRIFQEYASIPYAHGDLQREVVWDGAGDHYMLVTLGWEQNETRRVHGAIVHLDIIKGKIWVQYDGTEYGMAQELVDAGIPKSQIVLAFHPSYKRPHTEFAVA